MRLSIGALSQHFLCDSLRFPCQSWFAMTNWTRCNTDYPDPSDTTIRVWVSCTSRLNARHPPPRFVSSDYPLHQVQKSLDVLVAEIIIESDRLIRGAPTRKQYLPKNHLISKCRGAVPHATNPAPYDFGRKDFRAKYIKQVQNATLIEQKWLTGKLVG
jgi:hypothetical protein